MDMNNRILFSSEKIGQITIKNRFVRSATFEHAANEDGSIGDNYIKIYERLAQGEIGLIITGMIHVSPDGKSYHRQAGLHDDATISGFSDLTNKIHRHGSTIFAQLCHGGRQSRVQGLRPAAPSAGRPDLIYQVYPRSMNSEEILNVIRTYGDAAKRAQKAGFDGIQIHAAHGYLINEFLSPYFNRRRDEWGGSIVKRFALLKRVYQSVRDSVGPAFPVIVKINIADYTPKPGLAIEESAEYIKWLVEIGVDAVEISCGTLAFSLFNSSRGNVPVYAFAKEMIRPFQPFARMLIKIAYPENKYGFYENYNLWACNDIKPLMGKTPLILVGGLRSYKSMEKIVQEKQADFVSMCRPFIRQPLIVKKWSEGDFKQPTCANCNNCYAHAIMNETLKCNLNRVF